MKKFRKLLIAMAILLVVLAVGCGVYLGDYYHADEEAIEVFAAEHTVDVNVLSDGSVTVMPEEANAGFIFYPGGKVEHTAYIPLMQTLAEEGIFCVLVEMPFRLAVLDMDAAKGIQEQYPEIEKWYIGGHSLGGSMAASYLSDCEEEFDGLILLGAYSTADLTEKGIDVLSVYGSEDQVLNMENYKENLMNLPANYEENIINGGCHACFGMYGEQEGDGTPTISNEEQINKTSDIISEFIN